MATFTTTTGGKASATAVSTRDIGTSSDVSQTAELDNTTFNTRTQTTTTAVATAESATGSNFPPTLPSSYEWGPAITASALPAPAATIATPSSTTPAQLESGSGMSHGARNTLIATTTIGGTFVLAFLIYALLRRRKGATYSEILHFRPHSSTMILSPGPRHPDFTALPIYREERYSVRSTKRGSWRSWTKLKQKHAPSPSSETFGRGPWLNPHWKPANPSTPTRAGHSLSYVEIARPHSLQPPEMAHRAISQTERIRIKRTGSDGDILKPCATVSSRELSSSSDAEGDDTESLPGSLSSSKQLGDDSRWSWTNSQAPPTPKMRAKSPTRRPSRVSRASTGSLPSFRGKVSSWMKPQNERTVNRIPEEQAIKPLAKPRLPELKNKGSKPILAPVAVPEPSRRLSKKNGSPSVSIYRPRTKSVATQESGTASPGFSLPLQRN